MRAAGGRAGPWAAIAVAVALLAGSVDTPAAGDSSLPRPAVPADLKVVSYFPSDAGWTLMWERWRPARIDADLARAAGLGANTVRLVVQPHLFGYPRPQTRYLARLRATVALAARHRLSVQLTLFDWWGDYADLAGSRAWARAVLRPFRRDPRVALVEVRNEIDVADPAAMSWARRLIPFTRSLLGNRTPVTISVSGPEPLSRLRTLVRALAPVRPDLFSFHFYGADGRFAFRTLRRARAIAAPTPLWVGETGAPGSGADGERLQAAFLRRVAWAASANRLPPVGIWVLDDFGPDGIPSTGPRGEPVDVFARETERHFGLFRVDGTAKPSAAVARAAWANRVPRGFNNGFERGSDLPSDWTANQRGAEFARDDRIARQGHASARVSGETGSATLSAVPVEHGSCDGRLAQASVSARGAGVQGTARLVLRWYGWQHELRGEARSRAVSAGDTDWSLLTAAGRTPRQAVYIQVELEATDLRGTVWFDDVTLTWRGRCP